ncbi:MAG: type II secretion system GspH family protein [Candidatus Pacebacteria bacterium]|nr:type II secretion system GspH family protein [Candidatus Paceibacterota bacterium]
MIHISRQKGFTLLETLMVLGVFIIVLGALVASIGFFYRSNTHALEQSFAVQSARKGIEGMVKDIREATFSDEGAYPIVSIATSTITFYSDVDSDIFIERVRYFLDGTDLKRGVTDSAGDPLTYNDVEEEVSTISDNVRNNAESIDIFTYYNGAGSEISTASTTDVRFIKAEVVVNVNPSRLPNNYTLRSSATLRNLRDE